MLHNVKSLVLAVMGLIFILFSGFNASAKELPTIGMLYSHRYLVTDVNRMRGEVVIEDLEDGNEFVFSGLDRTDDIIICAHYVGYKEVM